MLAMLFLASCGGPEPSAVDAGSPEDAGPADAGLRVLFRAEEEEIERILLAVGEVRIVSDVGEDPRLSETTFRIVEPETEDADRVLFPLAPPGTYSRVEVRLETPPEGVALPSDFSPSDATAIVRATRDGVPIEADTAQETTWDLRCETGVKLAPGGQVDLVVDLDVEGWLEEGIDLEELQAAASLRCDAETGGDADSDADGPEPDAGPSG